MSEISFSEFVNCAEAMGMEPLQIICEYLIRTNQEASALELIPQLAKNQADKIQSQLDYARTWIPVKVDIHSCNKGITREQARMLDILTDYYCLGMEVPENYLKEVKEVISKMKLPTCIFKPMAEWLQDKYSIEFIDGNKLKGDKQ